MNCKFCGKPLVEKREFHVCDECETVGFFKEVALAETRGLISDYLKNIQCKVMEQQDFLHKIEQKYISHKYLTPDEQEIRKNILEFQSIRIELEVHVRNTSLFREKYERNLLYRLLILSEWLSNYFKERKDGSI